MTRFLVRSTSPVITRPSTMSLLFLFTLPKYRSFACFNSMLFGNHRHRHHHPAWMAKGQLRQSSTASVISSIDREPPFLCNSGGESSPVCCIHECLCFLGCVYHPMGHSVRRSIEQVRALGAATKCIAPIPKSQ